MLQELLQKIEENKKVIDSYRPFEDPLLLKQIHNFYKVDLTYSSNAIEGYTYTLSETKILIEDGLTAGGRPLKDAYAVIGHAKAYDYMFELMHNSVLTQEDIFFMHKLLENSLENNSAAGEYRKHAVFITGSRYSVAPVSEIETKMNELYAYLQENKEINSILLAGQFHKEFVFIHPFGDGNGRIARLGMNTLLIQRGYTPLIIHPVLRHEYIQALEQARVNDSNFLTFIARCEYESQKDLIRLLQGQN